MKSVPIRKLSAAVLYYALAKHLPASNAPGGAIWRGIRGALASRILDSSGNRLDISRDVTFGLGVGISIGNDSGLGIGAEVHGPLTIGRHVMISPGVLIHTRNHAFSDPERPIGSQGYSDYRPVHIGDDVWIGARAIILPGVQIGRGAIVGAGAVVPKSVPEFAIVAGNPARVVGWRRQEDAAARSQERG